MVGKATINFDSEVNASLAEVVLLFSYTFPTTWACSGLSPARARPWRANETCAARRMKKSRSRLFRARAVCEAYTSFPRGAHPRGAFYVIGISYHIKRTAQLSGIFPEAALFVGL